MKLLAKFICFVMIGIIFIIPFKFCLSYVHEKGHKTTFAKYNINTTIIGDKNCFNSEEGCSTFIKLNYTQRGEIWMAGLRSGERFLFYLSLITLLLSIFLGMYYKKSKKDKILLVIGLFIGFMISYFFLLSESYSSNLNVKDQKCDYFRWVNNFTFKNCTSACILFKKNI